MVRLAGLEPTASSSAGMRSILLSYKRVPTSQWCREWDLNPHARKGHCALNAARLPFRHLGLFYRGMSPVLMVGDRGFEPLTSSV